jgi:hypothetical protein
VSHAVTLALAPKPGALRPIYEKGLRSAQRKAFPPSQIAVRSFALRVYLHVLGITLRSVQEPFDESPTGKLIERRPGLVEDPEYLATTGTIQNGPTKFACSSTLALILRFYDSGA